jgi:hypothetical protein
MPGPPPKDPSIRSRRNKATGAGVLEDNRQKARVPPLPRRRAADGTPLDRKDPADWHPMARAWWRDVWRSPMAARFTRPDYHGLRHLAALVDQYERTPTIQLAAEIRQQGQRWGLDSLARWRLQWEVVGDAVPTSKARPAAPSPAAPPSAPGEDPRAILRAVK